MKINNTNKILLGIVILAVIWIISYYIVLKTNISKIELFNSNNLFTYFGILVGFSITIYTFGLTMIENIILNIDRLELSDEKKMEYRTTLVNGFKEIKEDIWIIFYSIIIVAVMAILKHIENPFGWDVEQYKIPETINLTLFIYSTLCMGDILKTLFNLSEINFVLINRKTPNK